MAKNLPLEPDDASAGKPYKPPVYGSGIKVGKQPPPTKRPEDKGVFTQEDLQKHGGTMKEPPRDVMPEDFKKTAPVKKAMGGMTKKYAKGGVTRADGCITKGKTRGKMV